MVPIHHRSGTYTPSPAQSIITASGHSPHGSFAGGNSAGASPRTPTGTKSPTTIVHAQVSILLGQLKEETERSPKWEAEAQKLKKLIDESGMEVFQKYFSRLVVGNAPQIFPGVGRPTANSGNYQILVNEIRKVAHDEEQAVKIAESVDNSNEDLFRDFDLSTFMEHFKMDALEKTVLALAFKQCSRSDLKTKADAILSANFSTFVNILSRPDANLHGDLSPAFVATIIDRFIQDHPPHFSDQNKNDLQMAIRYRYSHMEQDPPVEVLASLYLLKLRADRNPLIMSMCRIGSAFTADEETCTKYLRTLPSGRPDEEQVGSALLYATISRTPSFSTVVLVSSLRKEVGRSFVWESVVAHFDRDGLRISSDQFLALYHALKPVTEDPNEIPLDIQRLWGGRWQHSETQLSFINAYGSLTPEQLDATTIPRLQASFSLSEYAGAMQNVQERAATAVRHPLVSAIALDAVFHVALQSTLASDTPEAKRLFQEVVVPNLDVFVVSAFGVPGPWPDLATETLRSLFERFLFKIDSNYDFVLYSVWNKDKAWLIGRLIETHGRAPLDLPLILDHAVRQNWLYDLLILNGFGLDLAALAHAHGKLELNEWEQKHADQSGELAEMLLNFLSIKAQHELQAQRNIMQPPPSVMLPVKTVAALLNILTSILPRGLSGEQMVLQRSCITAYPRLVNYGEGYDDIIDENGRERNSLPSEANEKMEEHYKKMYSEEAKVRTVVEALRDYKHSRNPADQDVFACMIHGLFDEYALYSTYPLEALKTTAVLFGGIIKAKLLPDLPLEVALGMILDAVKENNPADPMFKFGVEALKQTMERFGEWPGFCRHLLRIPGLHGTDVWARAEEVCREQDERDAQNASGNGLSSPHDSVNGGAITNGNFDEMLASEPSIPAFRSLHVDPVPYNSIYEHPTEDTQEKVLFVLNNITERNLEDKFKELKNVVQERHQQWFAGHIVEQRAKMQPNYHQLYLGLVTLFGDKALWSEVLRETYSSVIRMLNAEATMQSSTERAHLKNLGGWLGSLTLARDKPIKHRNIAFKELLLEAFDTQRLLVVIPFVCTVLTQGASSTIFKPPNPWLMDIIHLLIELYQHAELKLNLRFEIEVLCRALNLDHKSIEPSTDIKERIPPMNEPTEPTILEVAERFDTLSMNGIPAGGSGRFSPQDITATIPDLGPLLIYPPVNDLVNQSRLQDIVRNAITRAVHEIVSPVVERSVTIAAISTAQMIHKDFAIEGDENRLRLAAISMVKRTAGSLALVTSKEPLRASMGNYIREQAQLANQPLPEGTIMMCVNANLEIACKQVENKAEERAVPEIEEMIEPEIEARRRWRQTRNNEPYVDPSLSRWAMTIPAPYKLLPGTNGLNNEQMAIYEEFSRQPRLPSHTPSAHGNAASDASRSLADNVLQEQYPNISRLPAPIEPPAMPMMNDQGQAYGQPAGPLMAGRGIASQMDHKQMAERIEMLLEKLLRDAINSPEQSYRDLPRPSPVLDDIDALISFMIRATQISEDAARFTADHILQALFSSPIESELAVQCLVHILDTLCKLAGGSGRYVAMAIVQMPEESVLNAPLMLALQDTDSGLLDRTRTDNIMAQAIHQRKQAAVECLSALVCKTLLVDRPAALYTDYARSFEAVYQWLAEDSSFTVGKQLVDDLKSAGHLPASIPEGDDKLQTMKDQMSYVFEEWINLSGALDITDSIIGSFIDQLHDRQIVADQESICLFLRICIDFSVKRMEEVAHAGGSTTQAYSATDALAQLIMRMVAQSGERFEDNHEGKAAYFESLMSFILLVLNHHHVSRGPAFSQHVFFRLFSTIMHEMSQLTLQFTEVEQKDIYVKFGEALLKLQPAQYAGFAFAWLNLVSHRQFMPHLLNLESLDTKELLVQLIEALMQYLGQLLKQLHVTPVAKDLYHGALKLLVVLHHDFPEFLAKNNVRLCAGIPPHCVQLHNVILTAGPSTFAKMPDPMQSGLKIDRVDDIRVPPPISFDAETPLKQAGLLDLINQALANGPSEDAVAHIAHAIQRNNTGKSTIGYVPIQVDLALIDAIVMHIVMVAVEKGTQKSGPLFIHGSTDSALITMLVRELTSEARYYFLNSMCNNLRYPNAHTLYFSQALLEVFGNDLIEQEEPDIQQQITRILLERNLGPWPPPWGLLVTTSELIKNDKYMFFDLPFIKSQPDVARMMKSLSTPAPM